MRIVITSRVSDVEITVCKSDWLRTSLKAPGHRRKMQGTVKSSSRTLKDMFQNLFRISTICGLFPFVFEDNDLILSFYFLPHSVLNVILVSYAMIYLIAIQFIKIKTYAFLFSCVTPCVLSAIVPHVSLFWLCINLKKLRKIFRALKVIEGVTLKHGPSSNRRQHFVVFFVVAGLFAIEIKKRPQSYIETFSFYLTIINVYLIMLQFTSILTAIRNYYSFLKTTLSKSTAVEWAQCHEVLGACCEIVNRCYSPQLFIFTLSTFTYITSTIYIIISPKSYNVESDRIVSIVWVFLLSLSLCAFIHLCHDTVHKAKNFDKELYRIVLNDSNKILLRNKRILYHFQAKRKVEFSAMGFFNFDYTLICRMVSTATTYLVILLQFTT